MKMNTAFSVILAMMMIATPLSVLSGTALAKDILPVTFAGGSGTMGDPYIIENATELQNMTSALNAHYVLGNDINASETNTWDDSKGFLPVGVSLSQFTGSLDGKGYNVTGLFINRIGRDDIGLFGYIGMSGAVSNVTLLDCNVTGNVAYNGGLAGTNFGTLSNCGATGKVKGQDMVGGLVGYNTGTISNCYADCDVRGTGMNTGGLVGYNQGSVSNCYATGNVSSTAVYTGGFAGRNAGSVSNCYATGNASGISDVGGFVGVIDPAGSVLNCFSIGNASGSGGIGGLVCSNSGTVTASFWDREASGTIPSDGGVGKTTTEMMDIDTFTEASWDFGAVWDIENEASYPYFRTTTPYTVFDLSDLQGLSGQTGNWTLANDLDASATSAWNLGTGFNPIGTAAKRFTGSLDGNNHTISGLFINRPAQNNVGLFGYTETTATIRNVRLVDCNVRGNSNVGALIGYSNGKVYNCSSDGIVRGVHSIGGLIGNANAGTIESSYSQCNVTADSTDAGGLVGISDVVTVLNCYAWGTITANDGSGGFIGYFGGNTITNCYSVGLVLAGGFSGAFSGIHNGVSSGCFWNYETSGQLFGTGFGNVATITGLNTTDMMTTETFTSAGWDFANTWFIVNGSTYPLLRSFYEVPSITTVDITSTYEDALYYVDYEAFISDYVPGNVGIWNISTNASWLTVGNDIISGTPANADVGSYWVRVTVTDILGNSSTSNFTLTVLNVNDDPEITTPPVNVANSGMPYSVDFDAIDIDPTMDVLTWSMLTNTGAWLGIDSTSGILSGTPGDADVGEYYVTVTVEDGIGGSDFVNYSLTVNDRPVITTASLPDGIESQNYSFNQTFNDIYENGRTWELDSNALWLNINPLTGEIYGIAAPGSFWVKLTLNDGHGLSGEKILVLVIQPVNVNDPPVITTVPVTTATQDAPYSLALTAVDPDVGDVLTWALLSGPAWLTLNGATWTLEGTPGNDDVGSYWVQVNVTDQHGANDTLSFMLTVNNVNDPPVITTVPVTTATQDVPYSAVYLADDPDGDTLAWTLNTNAIWLTMTSNHLQGTPLNEHVGTYWVNVSVEDGYSGTDSTNFTLTVNNVNDLPVITAVPVTTATQGASYSLALTAVDPDVGDVLTWTLLSGPAWLTLNVTTWTLEGTPGNDDVGSSWVEVKVEDLAAANDTMGFMLTVNNVNDLPVITTVDSTTATQDVPYSVLYQADDPDGDTLAWTLATNAAWLTMTGNHLYGTPTNDDVGVYWVSVSVDDGNGGTDSTNFTLTVINVNDPPVITMANAPEAVEGVLYSVNYAANDIDGDSLTWARATNATWLGINATTGVLSGTPAPGIFYVNVTVDDGNGGTDYTNFTLTAYSDSNGNGIPDYMDPDFLTAIEYNNQTVWSNATLWNNQTIPEYHNTTIWSNATVPEYHNTTVWANETVTVTNTETPVWAWGALIAAIVLGVVAAITVMKGGKGPKQGSGPKESSEPEPEQEPQSQSGDSDSP